MTGRPVTPAQKAADLLAAALNTDALRFKSGGWGSNPIDQARLEALGWVMTWLRDGRAAAALAAAGVLTDPDTHDRDAVNKVRALHFRRPWRGGDFIAFGQTNLHDLCDHCRANWPCATTAALDGAGTDAHGEGT